MIDPGKLWDWLDAQDVEVIRHEDTRRVLSRQDFEDLFRQYVAELTDRG